MQRKHPLCYGISLRGPDGIYSSVIPALRSPTK